MFFRRVIAIFISIVINFVISDSITLPTVKATILHGLAHLVSNVILPEFAGWVVVTLNLDFLFLPVFWNFYGIRHGLSLGTITTVIAIIGVFRFWQSRSFTGIGVFSQNHVVEHGNSTTIMNLVDNIFYGLGINFRPTPSVPILFKGGFITWEGVGSSLVNIIEEIWIDVHILHLFNFCTVTVSILRQKAVAGILWTPNNSVTGEFGPITFNGNSLVDLAESIVVSVSYLNFQQVAMIVLKLWARNLQVTSLHLVAFTGFEVLRELVGSKFVVNIIDIRINGNVLFLVCCIFKINREVDIFTWTIAGLVGG